MNIINRHANSYRYPFSFCSIISFVIFFILFDYSNIALNKIVQIILNILFIIGFNLFVLFQHNNDKIKQLYIDKCCDIKLEEEKNINAD